MSNVGQMGKSGGDASGDVFGGAGSCSGAMGGTGVSGGYGWGGGAGVGGDAKSSSGANVGNTGGDASDNTSIGSVTINS